MQSYAFSQYTAFTSKRTKGLFIELRLLMLQLENWGAKMVAMKTKVIFCSGGLLGCVLV